MASISSNLSDTWFSLSWASAMSAILFWYLSKTASLVFRISPIPVFSLTNFIIQPVAIDTAPATLAHTLGIIIKDAPIVEKPVVIAFVWSSKVAPSLLYSSRALEAPYQAVPTVAATDITVLHNSSFFAFFSNSVISPSACLVISAVFASWASSCASALFKPAFWSSFIAVWASSCASSSFVISSSISLICILPLLLTFNCSTIFLVYWSCFPSFSNNTLSSTVVALVLFLAASTLFLIFSRAFSLDFNTFSSAFTLVVAKPPVAAISSAISLFLMARVKASLSFAIIPVSSLYLWCSSVERFLFIFNSPACNSEILSCWASLYSSDSELVEIFCPSNFPVGVTFLIVEIILDKSFFASLAKSVSLSLAFCSEPAICLENTPAARAPITPSVFPIPPRESMKSLTISINLFRAVVPAARVSSFRILIHIDSKFASSCLDW